MASTLRISHNGNEYIGYPAKITGTTLGWESHGILTAFLHCEWPSGGVGVGGFCLDTRDRETDERKGTKYGLDHIIQLMKTVGVDNWEQLKGKHVVVLFKATDGSAWGSMSVGIANLLDHDRVFDLKEHAKSFGLESEEATV